MTYSGMYDISLMHLILIEFAMGIKCSKEKKKGLDSAFNSQSHLTHTHIFALLYHESISVTCCFSQNVIESK